tara:strand:+ start:21087 stop:22430 length:1344 start_codon:yes stop_codon:yes gene_type:complete
MFTKLLSLVLALTVVASVNAQDIVEEGHYLFDANKKLIKLIQSQGDLTIDHVGSHGYEVYGPAGVGQWLQNLADQADIAVISLDHEKESKAAKDAFVSYPTPDQIAARLQELQAKYPSIFKLFSIGQSGNGQELYAVKLSDNVDEDELEPEFKYIANMHGDEIVGREMMVLLLEDLTERYARGENDIKSLIDNTEIFIIPSMNPDGAQSRRRGNARWSDLNRNFPDFTTDNTNRPDGRQPETQAVMAFQAARKFALSANFHGGTECVNYPWDTTGDEFPLLELVKKLSAEYANDVPGMKNSSEFPGGITNGYDWYEVDGGMQDWSYHWHQDLQVTIELSHQKWPNYSTIPQYFKWNKGSMIRYMSRVHQGAGFKFETNKSGRVEIEKLGTFKSINLGEYTFGDGEFYKVLDSGRYRFTVTTSDGEQESFTTKVSTQSGSYSPNYTKL